MRQHFGRIVVVTFFTIPVASASPEDRRDVSVLNWPVPARGAASPLAPLSVISGGAPFDHPLDPENKYLSHSFVESPDMMDVYDGLVLLDGTGAAVVELPAWFEALNRDFRYQLTCIGRFAPVYVAEKVSSNRFRIAGGHPGLEVSWQITGIRHDAFANAHRIVVEEEKARNERGLFLHPSAFGEPDEKQIGILPPAR